jgi:hypothetical protein
VASSCEHSYDPLGSVECEEFVDSLGDYQLLKDCTPWSSLDDMDLVSFNNCYSKVGGQIIVMYSPDSDYSHIWMYCFTIHCNAVTTVRIIYS